MSTLVPQSSRIAGLVLIILGLVSCGGGQGTAPTLDPEAPTPSEGTLPPAAYTGQAWQSGASSPLGLLVGRITADGEVAELPLRQAAALGDSFDLDATQFFTAAPCSDCAKVAGVSREPGTDSLVLSIAIRHPFPADMPRRDLHVFDVRGILILPGAATFGALSAPINTDLTTMSTQSLVGDPGFVTNADGFTTHFDYHAEDPRYVADPVPVPGNFNAFKRYFVDGADDPFVAAAPAGHNVMPMGAPYETQDFVLDAGRLTVEVPFAFVVDARWGQSATRTTRLEPIYYLPAFNRQEAWKVDVNVMDNNLQANDPTSTAHLAVMVRDWQAAATVADPYPDSAYTDQVPWAGDVALVETEIPGVSNLDTIATPTSGGGTDANPYLYMVEVNNDLGAIQGSYTGLVAVRDELFGLTGPGAVPGSTNVNQGLDLKDYSAYQTFSVTVAPPVDDPPAADASNSAPLTILDGEEVTLDGSGSVDDGTIAKYEWDPGDGGGYVDNGTNPVLLHTYGLPPDTSQSQYTATLRVTDNLGQTDTDTVIITVSELPDNPPVADARATPSTINSGASVALSGSTSTDDYGITKYRWNPGDGAGWIDRGTNPNLNHTYTTASSTIYTATLEVTDTSGQLDTDTVQVTVNVINQPPVASMTGTAPLSGQSPLEVAFVGTASTDDQGITKFEWDPGDGTGWHDQGALTTWDYTYTVTSDSNFNARLRVTDGGGLTHIVSQQISVAAAAACQLTGISGSAGVNVGQLITLTAVGTAPSYSWSTTSSLVVFVGTTNGPSVQVQAMAPSVNPADIPIALSGGPGCSQQKSLTSYTLQFTSPATVRKQYVNYEGTSDPTEDRDVSVAMRVVPAVAGIAVTFAFTDPDEPAYQFVSGTSWTAGGDSIQNVEGDTTGNDNQGDATRPSGSSGGGSYTNGYALGGGLFSHTTTANTAGDGTAALTFQVSRYAGDNYTFTATANPAGTGTPMSVASPMITVWRKYNIPVYSMENSGATNEWFYLPNDSSVNTHYAPAYIEMFNNAAGYGGLLFTSPLTASVAGQFNFIETTGTYDTAGEKYAQTPHGQMACGLDRYTASSTIGLWTGSYIPSKLPPNGLNGSDKPYTTRNYFTLATGRMRDLWGGSTLTDLENHVFSHEMGHSLGLPHNDSSTSGTPALTKHGSSGIGVMAPATGPGIKHLFTEAELRFLRGHDTVSGTIYRGPYFE